MTTNPTNILELFQKADSGNKVDLSIYLVKILSELISADDKTLDLKTETHEPKELAIIKEWIEYASDQSLLKVSFLWKNFLTNYERLMFSLDRKSRNEIVQCIIAFLEKEKEKNVNSQDSLLNSIRK